MSIRRCPRCQSTYDPPARFCTRDGSPLVEMAPPAAPAPAAVAAAAAVETGPMIFETEASDAEMARRYSTLSNQVLDHRYQVQRKIGEGGMSYVYQALELDGGRTVAVKILIPRLSRDPGSVERLKREAQMAMRLSHPHVCPVLRYGQTEDGMLYLVMPFLAGEPLNDHETRRGPYPVEEGVETLVQICHGLQHAHDLGIVHRDLKPENIMLVPERGAKAGGFRAVVMDFGLAKERHAGPEVQKLTQTGIVLGTPEFMSPEQIRGKPLDGRSDQYALAVLAFEMFTGQLPFAGKTSQEMMLARLRGQPASLRQLRPDLPARLDAAIMKAMSMQPDDRYGSMEQFAHALEHSLTTGVFARLFGR
ncbi:MAG TPA: serine/threonine-protein kinase [Gemmatimonadales bacterium]|nr:serine/threonine-protein kinase [Gemmatimonadales bacterium]